MDMTGVEVVPNRAFKQSRILWNDGQATAQIQQTNAGRVDSVNGNIARVGLDDTEQGQSQRRLASTRPSNDTDLLVRLDVELDVLENQVKAFTIAGAVVVELNLATSGPAGRRPVAMDNLRGLAGKTSLLENTFDRDNVRLHLDSLADNPVERGGDGEGVRHSKAHPSCAELGTVADGNDRQTSCRQDHNTANEFKANREPPVGADGGEVCAKVRIHSPLVLKLEPVLLPVCPNCRDAAKGFLEMGIDWTAAHTVQSLELSGCAQVVSLDEDVHGT